MILQGRAKWEEGLVKNWLLSELIGARTENKPIKGCLQDLSRKIGRFNKNRKATPIEPCFRQFWREQLSELCLSNLAGRPQLNFPATSVAELIDAMAALTRELWPTNNPVTSMSWTDDLAQGYLNDSTNAKDWVSLCLISQTRESNASSLFGLNDDGMSFNALKVYSGQLTTWAAKTSPKFQFATTTLRQRLISLLLDLTQTACCKNLEKNAVVRFRRDDPWLEQDLVCLDMKGVTSDNNVPGISVSSTNLVVLNKKPPFGQLPFCGFGLTAQIRRGFKA
jgi:hypothetical protein